MCSYVSRASAASTFPWGFLCFPQNLYVLKSLTFPRSKKKQALVKAPSLQYVLYLLDLQGDANW